MFDGLEAITRAASLFAGRCLSKMLENLWVLTPCVLLNLVSPSSQHTKSAHQCDIASDRCSMYGMRLCIKA